MATIEFYDRTMSETMGLLVDARRYLSDRAETDTRALSIDQGLASSVETMRLVSRLTEALAWLLRQDNVISIPKATAEQHVRDNHAALDITLTPDDLVALDQAFPPPKKARPLEMI